MAAAAAVVEADDDVFTTAGLHPHSAAEWSDAVDAEIRERAAHPRCVAIGETGLDWFRDRAPRDAQRNAFRGQLRLARELQLPVVIHCRDAVDDVFTTAGLHPHSAAEWSDAVDAEIRERAAHPRCVAIGETGLDWFRDRAPRDAQRNAFRGQLRLARELQLPVVIHCRDAVD